MGLNCVPAHPHEKHPAGAWKGLASPDARRVTGADIAAGLWVLETFPEEELQAFLFPSSHPVHPLVVVDVDDMAWLAETVRLFGETEYFVETRRGVHLYYRGTPDTKVTSRSWLFGERSVDVKAWNAGVMAPGARAGLYKPNIPLDQWKLSEVPLFDVEAYEATWAEYRPKARAAARAAAARNPRAYVYIEQGIPVVTASGLEQMGDVAGDTMVTHERTGGVMRLDAVPAGDKVFAFDREDSHASGQVWEGAGQRWYTDHTFGALWRVVGDDELEWVRSFSRAPDPVPNGGGLLDDLRAMRFENMELSIEVHELPADGFITIPEADGLTIVKAPHGTGKTYLARTWMDAASSGVSVCNTAALAEHNAAKFGVDCYQEKDHGPKVSTTINSLPKLGRDRVDFFHVDEADQVHGYLHSGTMADPVENMRAMLDLCASAPRTLIASADLGIEDISWYVSAYGHRNPAGRIRVFVRPPSVGTRTVRMVPLPTAKGEFERAYTGFAPGDYPLALGWTARRDVGNLAWGYAGRRGDLRCFWVSGENSRFSETIERFRGQWTDRLTDTPDFLDAADVFIFSPALQSGVSLESTTGRVFILHTKADFEVETIAQMLMRFRDVRDATVVWGVSQFGRRVARTDDAYLEGVCVGLADETDRQIAQCLPAYTVERVPQDAEYAWSWRITQRRIRRSYSDPIGRAKEVIEGHGWKLVDETGADESDLDADTFNQTRTSAAALREAKTAAVIADASPLDEAGAHAIDRAHVHHGNDAQRLERKRIADFYGLEEVTVEDVMRDANGKFRTKCRMYTWLLYRAAGVQGHEEGTALAFFDWRHSTGRQPSEYRHIVQKATMLLDLWNAVTDGQSLRLPAPVAGHDVRERMVGFMQNNGRHYSELFRSAVPSAKKAIAFFGAQLRRCGAVVTKTGRNGDARYTYDFQEVHVWSGAYRARLLDEYKNESENKQWQNRIRELKAM